MRRLFKLLTCLFLTTLASSVGAQGKVGWEDGNFLPDLELPTIDGSATIKLSELRGQRLLLIQFASW